jgi:ABC-type sugar transport system ATPase subunit
VWIGPDVVTNWLPRNRGIGIVPQDGALFDGMRVEAMLALPLRARGIRRAVRRLNVQAMAEHLGIESLLRRTSAGLSGGERQRIALGRALICKPRLLCLDEPLSAVDRDTAASLRTMLIALRDQTNVTVLHVTHDAAEAKALATAIWHMEDGVLTPVTAQKV